MQEKWRNQKDYYQAVGERGGRSKHKWDKQVNWLHILVLEHVKSIN